MNAPFNATSVTSCAYTRPTSTETRATRVSAKRMRRVDDTVTRGEHSARRAPTVPLGKRRLSLRNSQVGAAEAPGERPASVSGVRAVDTSGKKQGSGPGQIRVRSGSDLDQVWPGPGLTQA